RRTWHAQRSRCSVQRASPIAAGRSLPTRRGSARPPPCRFSSAGCSRTFRSSRRPSLPWPSPRGCLPAASRSSRISCLRLLRSVCIECRLVLWSPHEPHTATALTQRLLGGRVQVLADDDQLLAAVELHLVARERAE